MNVIKRSGMEVSFDKNKIVNAITKAKKDTPTSNISTEAMEEIAEYIEFKCGKLGRAAGIEEIQDMVEQNLMARGEFELAKNYVRYRYKRELIRKKNTTDDKILALVDCMNEEATQENANKNTHINSTQRDYIAGEVSRDITRRMLLPEDVAKADKEGLIHVHDQDYMIQHMFNCCLINLEDMLQNGTVISGTKIDKPHSFSVACNISTQIMAQVASNQYGGQSVSLAHLAPFVDVSRQSLRKDVVKEFDDIGFEATEEIIDKITEERLMKEINKGIQTIQYQILTLSSVNGQAPFVSVFIYLNETKSEREKKDLAIIAEEMLKQRIQGVKNAAGQWVTPAFPKILYVLEPDNISEDQPYWYLTELAAKCTAKRMVPDYISEKIMFENKEGNCFPSMGCRSFLSVWKDNNKPKFYGRFNCGVCTINLPDVALSSHKDINEFWKIFDERLELCHKALLAKYDRLKGIIADYSPIHWMYGAIARLKSGEKIDKYLHGGYSTISLGYAGLYECVKYMTGVSHTDEKVGKPFALKVMQHLNDKCEEWKKKDDLGYSVYGSPIESSTYKFAKCLQKRFGIVEGITDHNYVTNSYHVFVKEPIDIFHKLKLEAEFQKLSPGGLENTIPEKPPLKCVNSSEVYM